MMITFTDTHCHLNYHSFEEDLSTVIKRASDHGLDKIMIPGIDIPACHKAVEISEQFSNCYAALGIHPNDANTWNEDTIHQLRVMKSQSNNVLAIGEIGLDYYRDWSTPTLQKTILREQLALAKELNLPIIVHIRETIEDSFNILFEWQAILENEKHPLAKRPGVLHAFPGSLEDGLEAIDHHFKIGVGGQVTFKSAAKLRAIVTELPLTSILLETDAPFLTPHPHRGKRNEPAYIPFIAEKIAELKDISLEEVSKITTANAQVLFQW
jgi:TatD DNase family protein